MRGALLAILLVLPLAFAAQSPFEKFLSVSFEPGQSVGTAALSTPGYMLITADGKETYVFDLQAGKPVYANGKLQSLLEDDAKSKGGFEAKFSSAQSFSYAALSAKEIDEKKCMQYTGTDMHECVDRDTCVLACKANPYCSGADGQSGPLYSDGFWEAILDWTASRKAFSSLLLSYNDSMGSIATDAAAINSKISELDSLASLSSNMSKNPLFLNRTDEGCAGGGSARCFEFCKKIDYSQVRIADQKQNLQSLRTVLAEVQNQPARALAISGNGRLNDGYLANRGRNWEEFRLQMYNAVWKLSGRAAELSKNVTDPAIAPMLGELSNLSATIVAKADAGYYRSALAQREEFESLQSELSGAIDSDSKAHSGMLAAIASALERVGKAEKVIGKESANYYREDIAAISGNVSSAPTLEELGAAREKLSALTDVLTAETAAKAVGEEAPQKREPQDANATQQGNATQQPPAPAQKDQKPSYPQPMQLPGIPCLPAAALLLLVLAAVGKRESL